MPRPRRWTDDDLRAAVAASTSLAEVVRRLRLSHGGAAYVTVRTAIEQLGLSVEHFTAAGRDQARDGQAPTSAPSRPAPRTRWDEGDLATAVAEARSLHDVFTRLGLTVGGSQWQVLRQRIRQLQLDTSHWTHPLDAARHRDLRSLRARLGVTDLVEVIRTFPSRAEFLRHLGAEPSTTTYALLADALRRQGVDQVAASRWRGGRPPAPLDDLLRAGRDVHTSRLRDRLIAEGVKSAACELCGLRTWHGGPAPLQLDHVDGDRCNNVLENLRILCANCHAQTDTFAARNRGRWAASSR